MSEPMIAASPSQAQATSAEAKCTCGPSSRRLVVCIDGTSNQFSTKNTNVVELYNRLDKDGEQLTFYNSGIGTYATPSWKSWRYRKQVITKKIDLAIAWNFEKILLGAYLWLSENYQEGDRIFLFGFSRGAYQVRALSAMIHMVGLLHKGNGAQIPFAYQLYAETKPTQNVTNMRSHFKKTFSRSVKVHFIGVWDTVSSVGMVRDKTLPGTTDGMLHTCYFRHALALHERRVKFLPEYARGGVGPRESETQSLLGTPPHTKEVWFAGSHSDIGGGGVDNMDMNQFVPALRWMSFEAIIAGVKLTGAPQVWESNNLAVRRSLTLFWWLLELVPIRHLSYTSSTSLSIMPHRGSTRRVLNGQLVHQSALKADSAGRRSAWRATLPSPLTWDEARLRAASLIESDPYTEVQGVVEDMKRCNANATLLTQTIITALHEIAPTEQGRRSLRDSADTLDAMHAAILLCIDTMSKHTSTQATANTAEVAASKEAAMDRVEVVADAVVEAWRHCNFVLQEDKKHPPSKIWPLADLLRRKDEDLADLLMVNFASPHLTRSNSFRALDDVLENIMIRNHSHKPPMLVDIWAVKELLLTESGRYALRDSDRSIHILSNSMLLCILKSSDISHLDVDSRRILVQQSETLLGALSALNVPEIAVDVVQRWKPAEVRPLAVLIAEKDRQLARNLMSWFCTALVSTPIECSDTEFTCVAYSPEPTKPRIIAGRDNGTVVLWDIERDNLVRPTVTEISSHKKAVPDRDAPARLTPLYPIRDFEGPTAVHAIAVSPDGTMLATAAGSVRVWTIEPNSLKLSKDLPGSSSAATVGFSHDGKRVAFGYTNKLRICEISTASPVGRPIQVHTDTVMIVHYSWDVTTKRIVSASSDGKIAVFDAHSGETLRIITQHLDTDRNVLAVAFSKDGQRLASAGSPLRFGGMPTIRIWDLQSGDCVLQPESGHSGDVNCISFCPEGTRIASGGDDHTVRICDATTGHLLYILRGHRGYVRSLAFSPDGSRIVSVCGAFLCVWDAEGEWSRWGDEGESSNADYAA